jgi:LacI family transcriptional regulator
MVAADNMTAFGCMEALMVNGRRVPEDIAVVSFDEIAAAALRPLSLTTMTSEAQAMGSQAVDFVVDRLEGTGRTEPRRISVRGRLNVRTSCGTHDA